MIRFHLIPPLVVIASAVTTAAAAATATTRPGGPSFWYTYPDPSCNRVVGPGSIGDGGDGGGSSPDDEVRIVDVDFGGSARLLWAVGVATTPSLETFSGNGTEEGEAESGDDDMFRFVVTLANGTAYIVGPARDDDDDDDDRAGTWGATPLGDYSPLSAEQPPLVRVDDEGIITVVSLPDAADLSPLSHPVPIPSLNKKYVYIASNGDVVLWEDQQSSSGGGGGGELHRLTDVGALPDGRIAVAVHLDGHGDDDGDGVGGGAPLLALYGGSTDSFRHCVLGDCLEGTRLLLIRVVPGDDETSSSAALLEVEADVRLPESTGEVFEGISPFFYRDDHGRLVVVTTVGDPSDGARLQTYSRSTVATAGGGVSTGWRVRSVGPSIGWGWRHQLFRDHLGPNATVPALVDVLAPHVRMTVEFFDDEHDAVSTAAAADDDVPRMDPLASTSRYTTHRMGSRVLDTAVGCDFDGDGIREAVVLGEDYRSLVGIGLRSVSGVSGGGFDAEEAWRLPLPSTASSNLAAVAGGVCGGGGTDDGRRLALGIGSGNVFRMWLPPRSHCQEGNEQSGEIPSSSSGPSSGQNVASTLSKTSENSAAACLRGVSPWFRKAVAVVSWTVSVVALFSLNPS